MAKPKKPTPESKAKDKKPELATKPKTKKESTPESRAKHKRRELAALARRAPPSQRKVPETIAKHEKREKDWEWAKKKAAKKEMRKAKEKKLLIYEKARKHLRRHLTERARQVLHKKVAESENKGFYVPPEPKVVFIVRIKGLMKMHPKSRTILKYLRLHQLFNGVFLAVNKATMNMLRLVEPYVTYGYPNRTTIKNLIYKRGYGKLWKKRLPLNNDIIEKGLGKYGIVCMEDLVHTICTVGRGFKQANNFLWPFRLRAPRGGISRKRKHFIEGGQFGNREEYINPLVKKMN